MKQPSQKQIYLKTGYQRGLSLIELMVSITIGLLILVSLSSMFINQSKSRAELDKSNRMIDNGRYALELLSGNLRLAGFYDNYKPDSSANPTNIYNPCDTAPIVDPTKNLHILLMHLQGYNAAASGTPTQQEIVAQPFTSVPYTGQLPCGLTYTAGSNLSLRHGSDVLVVRRAGTAVTAAAAALSGTTYLQVSMCENDAAQLTKTFYQILTAPAAGSFASMHKKDCTNPADLRPFMVLTYFVSPSNNPTIVVPGSGCTVGDCIPTLKQIDQYGNVTPLAEGIEYMQVDYGIDGDNTGDGLMDDINGDGFVDAQDLDGAPDSYSSTCTACATSADWAKYWSHVVSVRISLLARNTEQTPGWSDDKTYSLGLAGSVGPFHDAYKRHAFTQLIRLVNPSGRRE